MIISAEIDSLPYFNCPRHKHTEQLSMVCLEDTCNRSMLICPLCQLENHQHHNTSPLKMFLQTHLQTYDQKSDQLLMQKLGELQQIQTNAKKVLSQSRESFLEHLYKIQVKITEYFNSLADKLLQTSRFKKKEEVNRLLLKQVERGELANCNEVLKMVKMNSKITSKSTHQYYVISTNAKFSALKLKMAQIVSQKKFSQLNKIFSPVKDPLVRPDYYWSQFKGSKIVVQGLVATQSHNSSNGERFALMQSEQQVGSDITTYMKIRKVKGWIGVGICLKNVIVKAGYKFHYTMNYHGSYLISTNGYCWSHSDPEYNSFAKSFLFNQGDIIKIDYSIVKKEIVFTNLKKEMSFKLQVIDAPLYDHYVPCANLCNPGDEVEIINHPQ